MAEAIPPATDVVPITLHDTNVQEYIGFLVGVGGTLVVETKDGNERTLVGLTSGAIYLIHCTKFKTGGTATDIFGLVA